MIVDNNFWKGKRVFITGHTGFKGGWLSIWFDLLGARVKGYSLAPATNPSLFTEAGIDKKVDSEIGDIRNIDQLKRSMIEFSPDVLIHMAAQPLVRYSYNEPIETYETNVIGTAKVLESARYCSNLKSIISVTTDKCYENKEWEWGYRENDSLGGYDPYSSSKACAELVTSAYRSSYLKAEQVGLASVRAGNVIGGGDWAEDRLIPDILRAFEKNKPVVIRNPKSTRPWQHVLEPLSGYLILAQKLYEQPDVYAEGWNFGPRDDDVKPVDWILNKIVAKWSGASWVMDNQTNPHEAGYLKLDISKVKTKLGWQPVWNLEQTLERIVNWHKAWMDGNDMLSICQNEINDYMRDMINEYN